MKRIILALLLISVCVYAQDVIRYNGSQQELDNRWKWAINQAGKSGTESYWIVYTLERLMPENSTIGHYYHGENTGKKLAEILYPNRPVDYIKSLKGTFENGSSKKVIKEIALFYKMENETVIKVEMSTLDVYFNLKKLPLFWLGLTTEKQSIRKIIDAYNNIKSEEAKETLISAAGMHKSDDKAYNFLKKVIEDEKNMELREEAVFWIGNSGNPQAIPFLKNIAFTEHANDIGEKAVFSLYNIGSEQAIDVIIDIAQNARGDSREKAIFWLGQLAGKKAMESLEEIAFSEEETKIQKQAVFALSQLDDDKGIPKLIKIAKSHPNPNIRKNAIFWLGESEDERALDALIEIVQK